jgi:hypothetical protein
MAMGFLTRDQILGARDLKVVEVEVPEWGGRVRVSMMTGTERDGFEAETVIRRGKKVDVNMVNMRARLVARTVVDETGARLFSDEDVLELAKKSSAALNRVFETARVLNGLTEEATAEAAQGFPNGQSGDSISD